MEIFIVHKIDQVDKTVENIQTCEIFVKFKQFLQYTVYLGEDVGINPEYKTA